MNDLQLEGRIRKTKKTFTLKNINMSRISTQRRQIYYNKV